MGFRLIISWRVVIKTNKLKGLCQFCLLVELALAARLLKCKSFLFFFSSCVRTESEITVPGVLSGDRGKWETIIATSPTFRAPCMFREESLEKIKAKDVELIWNGSVHEFYRLKALITLEQVNASVVEKKKNLNRCCLKTSRSVLSGLKHRGEAESF